MKCILCGKKFHEGDRVIPVSKYVETERRGDFVQNPSGYIHLSHLGGK